MAGALDKRGIGGAAYDENELASGPLGLFSPPVAEGNMLHVSEHYASPVTVTGNAGPFEFVLPATGNLYIDLSSFDLMGYFRVEVYDKTSNSYIKPKPEDEYSVVNLAPSSLFKQIEVELNGTNVEDLRSPLYASKCFLETMLSHDYSARMTHLMPRLFICDDEVDYDDNTSVDRTGRISGYIRRRNFVKDGQKVPFCTPIHASIFNTGSRLLPPGISIKIKLTRNADSFTILANTDEKDKYRIVIEDLKVKHNKITVRDAIVEAHSSSFINNYAYITFHKTEMQNFVIPSNVTSYVVQNAITGDFPHNILFGMCDVEALDGSPKKNPFVFSNYNLIQVYLTINGMIVPPETYEMDFENKDFFKPYLDALSSCGGGRGNSTIFLPPQVYQKCFTLFGFDMSADSCAGFHQHVPERTGNINIHLKFSSALTAPVKLMLYKARHATLAIDKERNVSLVDGLANNVPKKK